MSAAVDVLLRLLNIETLDLNLFRGATRNDGFPQVFGGQVVGQALVAACRTVPLDRAPQSLHAYFLRPGDMIVPITYEVERIRDGGSFTTRRVQAIQHGEPIFSMMASFHVREDGWDHQVAMPDAIAPDTLLPGSERYRQWLASDRTESPGLLQVQATAEQVGIEFRQVDAGIHPAVDGKSLPSQQMWFRCPAALPDSTALHAGILAYASDFNLLGTSKLPHGGYFGQPDTVVASIDHAVWFHRETRVDDWLLYCMDSPSAHAARGYTRGQIFDHNGRLVASVTQEGLIRGRRPRGS